MSMAVSSIKGCWDKFSARIRDYLDVVDSYYRPPDCGTNDAANHHHQHHHHHHHHHNHYRQQQQQQADSTTATTKVHTCQRRLIRSMASAAKENSKRLGLKASSNNNLVTLDGNHSHNKNNITHAGCNGRHHSHKHNCRLPNEAIIEQHHHEQHAKQATTSTSNNNRSHVTAYFSKRKTSQGQVYFVDGQGQKYWYDPSVPKELLCASLNLDSLVGSLSATWEIRQTSSGKTYYVNHSKRTTQFTDPRLVAYKDYLMRVLKHAPLASSTTSRPPTNTTTTTTSHNRSNLNLNMSSTATTTATDASTNTTTIPINAPPISPSQRQSSTSNSPVGSPFVSSEHCLHHDRLTATSNQPTIKANRELFDKISILRQELLKQQVIAHPCRIDINRKKIFEESFRIVAQMQPRDLKKRLLVKFRGEEGLDYGGVAREWFYLLSCEILNPIHGLFQYTSDDIYNLQINPDSGIVYREHLSYMNFCGRVIGMAVFHGHFIEGRFTLPFYKMLLKKSITLSDIELVDPDLHRSLCWILENDITNVIDTTFLVQHNAFGQLQEHELKENGRNIVVTETNKHEYVSLYVNYRCRRGIANQFEALQRGFYELISPYLVENFDEHELELLIGGLSKINVEDWRLHTKLKNCTVESPLVKWFWDIVKSYSEDKRARLLQFVTGSPRVPIQGFKALQGVNSELRLFTIHLIRNACTDNLPKSHTCFNRIDLPHYESYEKLRDKLTQAIEETMGFAMQ